MTAVNCAIRQIVGIVYGRRGHGGCQDEAVIDINAGMFFKPKVGDIIFDSPVWLQISGEFERLLSRYKLEHMNYVYTLLSGKDGNFYTGSTSDLKRRLKEHNAGGVNSTKNRRPLELIYYEACLNVEDSRQRERYLKSGMGKKYLKNRLKKYLENL